MLHAFCPSFLFPFEILTPCSAVSLTHLSLLQVHRGLVALQSKGDVTMAVDLITKALELDEKCEFAYETLGTIEVGLLVLHSSL